MHCYRIEAPARLHLGFVDLNGDLGRRYGSVGLTISGHRTVVMAESSHELEVLGLANARARQYLQRVLAALQTSDAVKLTVLETILPHAGLGSGTQLALAVAYAAGQALNFDLGIRSLASLTGRGERSGIGVAAFETGGFIVDGGRAEGTRVPPVLSRLAFPESWRVILILDQESEGLNGQAETSAFATLPPMSASAAAELSRLTLVGLLPAVAEARFEEFCRHLARLQVLVGEYFAPSQGGYFTSPLVAAAAQWAAATYGVEGVGQSSWGPTGFVFVRNAEEAAVIHAGLSARFEPAGRLRFQICAGCNHGARVSTLARRPQQHAAGADELAPISSASAR